MDRKKHPNPPPAIGYCRVSTEEQVRGGISLENQEEKIQAYSTLKNFSLIRIIVDPGCSAKELNRPGVQDVLSLVRSKKVNAIIVYKLDRLFRDASDALITIKLFDQKAISFHSIEETIDTKGPMGKFFFTMLAAMAEWERNIISERTRDAMFYKRSQRFRVGDIPFGWDLIKNNRLRKNHREQLIIDKIKRMRGRGYFLRDISSYLHSVGVKTKKGRDRWSAKVLRAILVRESVV